ncbi:MAG: DUF2058 domain-containing protein [Gammaproteobacteria bacterium]
MSSFQDQLLKAGLVDSKKVKKATREKRKAQKLQKNSKEVVVDEAKVAAAKAQAEKVEHDRKLNEERKAAAEAKAIKAQIRQLIEMNRQPKAEDDNAIGYNFTEGKSVKKIYVSPVARDQLAKGLLAIVKLGAGYEVVPAIVADKIKQRDETVVLYQQESTASEDDLYAEHQIPDDLMW